MQPCEPEYCNTVTTRIKRPEFPIEMPVEKEAILRPSGLEAARGIRFWLSAGLRMLEKAPPHGGADCVMTKKKAARAMTARAAPFD